MMQKLIKNFLILSLILMSFGCQDQEDSLPQRIPANITTSDNKTFSIEVVYQPTDLSKGVSGILPADFKDNQGLLFFFPEMGRRDFWMPDTYFDLDIIYLDSKLKVLEIQRDVSHHIGNQEPIPRAKPVLAQHVLEIKSSSSLRNSIQIGDELKFEGDWENLSKNILIFLRKQY